MRTMKQLIDVLRQLALVAPVRETRRSAEQAADQLFRGVVAASSAIEVVEDLEAVAVEVDEDGLRDERSDDDPQG